MIKRLVRMDLQPGKKDLFMAIFEQVKSSILAQEGCQGLEIWESSQEEQTSIWTISTWKSFESLERYRQSELFRQTWTAVKPYFSGKASAWTLTSITPSHA